MLFRNARPRIELKSRSELESMRKAGKLAAESLAWICSQVEVGMTTQNIDDLQVEFAARHKVICAPLHYRGYPKSICTSVNNVICHGIPDPKRILLEGDIVGIDVTLIVDGFHGDTAATIPIGKVSEEAMRLMKTTLESLRLGIKQVRPKNRLGAIGHAIQNYVEPKGYSVVRDFVGHGIGRKFHEEPQVAHVGKKRFGPRLLPGMVFTIEPMINIGHYDTHILEDDWTAVTSDGFLSAQYEHTIAVTPTGWEIMTIQGSGWEAPGRIEL